MTDSKQVYIGADIVARADRYHTHQCVAFSSDSEPAQITLATARSVGIEKCHNCRALDDPNAGLAAELHQTDADDVLGGAQ